MDLEWAKRAGQMESRANEKQPRHFNLHHPMPSFAHPSGYWLRQHRNPINTAPLHGWSGKDGRDSPRSETLGDHGKKDRGSSPEAQHFNIMSQPHRSHGDEVSLNAIRFNFETERFKARFS